MKKYFNMFFLMLKIGLFTFGGGYAMIALIENEVVSKRGWIDRDEFIDMVAIAESTPGPIAINAATYIGYKMLGFFGSVLATVAICIPSFVIIYVISLFFNAFLSIKVVESAFKGIQAAIVYIIAAAGLKLFKQIDKTAFNISIVTLVTVCMILLSVWSIRFSTVFYILICGGIGLFRYLVSLKGKGRNNEK